MEELIEEGHCQAVLDITTTEWADELCGGILSAGSTRLDGPGQGKDPACDRAWMPGHGELR